MSWWQVLGVNRRADERAIKRAYAGLIKQFRPDSHPVEFARIRQAYEAAMEEMRWRARQEEARQREVEEAKEEAKEKAEAEASEEEEAEDDQAEGNAAEPAPLAVEGAAGDIVLDAPALPESDPATPPPLPPRQGDAIDAQAPAAVPVDGEIDAEPLAPPVPPVAPVPASSAPDTTGQAPDAGDARAPGPALAPSAFEARGASAAPRIDARDWVGHVVLALEEGEQAALQVYREQIRALDELSVDDRMQYEETLLHWLMFADQPALLVLLEAAHRFEWWQNLANVRALFGNEGERGLHDLQTLARYYFLARHYINRWERRLFSEGAARPRIGMQVHIRDGRHLAAQWQLSCESAGLPRVQALADPRMAQHLRGGFFVSSVDIAFGLLFTWIAWGMNAEQALVPDWLQGVGVAAVFGVAASSPGLLRWLIARYPKLAHGWARLQEASKRLNLGWTVLILLGIAGFFFLLLAIFTPAQVQMVFTVLMVVVFTALIAFLAWLLWTVLLVLDYFFLSWPWRMLAKVQLFRLEQQLQRGCTDAPASGVGAMLRAVPQMWRAKREARRRERELAGKKSFADFFSLKASWATYVFLIWLLISIVSAITKR